LDFTAVIYPSDLTAINIGDMALQALVVCRDAKTVSIL